MFNRGKKKIRNIRMAHNDGFFQSMPTFFKVWFGFVFTTMISIFALVFYTIFSVASDPDSSAREIGRLIGEVSAGYEETAN